MAGLELEDSAKISNIFLARQHTRNKKYDIAPSGQVIASGMNEPSLPLTVAMHLDVRKSVRVHNIDLCVYNQRVRSED